MIKNYSECKQCNVMKPYLIVYYLSNEIYSLYKEIM